MPSWSGLRGPCCPLWVLGAVLGGKEKSAGELEAAELPTRAPQWSPLGLLWAPSTPPSMAVPRPLGPGAQLLSSSGEAGQWLHRLSGLWSLCLPWSTQEGPPWTLHLLLSSLQTLSLENGPCGSRQKSLCAALSGPSGPSVFPLCCDPSRPGPLALLR